VSTNLLAALGVTSVDDIDPERPITLGGLELSIEATVEAIRILTAADYVSEVDIRSRNFDSAVYWSVDHQTEGSAEIFGFPPNWSGALPTAIEIAIVRAISAMAQESQAQILGGGFEICLGPRRIYEDFKKILELVTRPLTGSSLLYNGANQAIISESARVRIGSLALNCIKNSFTTSPLKYRFLELYRIMENLFLNDVKARLLSDFDNDPSAALNDASDALKSEVIQLSKLAEAHSGAFETCWDVLDALKNSNRFVAALFRRVGQKKLNGGEKWKTGAALIYQTRCAIVHAGTKDMIFESFPDGDAAIEALLPHVERAALMMLGVELV